MRKQSLLSQQLEASPITSDPELNPRLDQLTNLVVIGSKKNPLPSSQEIHSLLEIIQDYAAKFYLCDIMPDIDSLSQDKEQSLGILKEQLQSLELDTSETLLQFIFEEVNEFYKFLLEINRLAKEKQEELLKSKKDTKLLSPEWQDQTLDILKKRESEVVIGIIETAKTSQSYKDAAKIGFYKDLSKFIVEDYSDKTNSTKPVNIKQKPLNRMLMDFKTPPENSPTPSHKSPLESLFNRLL